ncbi:DUF2252 domain-containing protein [Pedobacter sp. MC2016-14]|uniref:DUF2252 domain-containing protein n=1 Tax=Pedobacter sp. MC2016-14 TaxID=2897327 RepID=UPI001E5FFE3E|nr:DUF2252 family protein [Pedobacter sp. MC2016-14]MCD0489800.1 DUF2252 domain-containing protein [Pedobacter sp. MC2016-14]
MSKIIAQLKSFNANRLPEMVKLKYEAMAENAFRFFRGTCHIFYARLSKLKIPKSPSVWICGDLHLENFGSYKADNKLVYFDLNDFDEAALAPALWEVLRLLASIFIAFDSLGIGDEQAMNMALLFIKSYSSTLKEGKAINIDPRTAKGILKDFLKNAEESTYAQILHKRTAIAEDKVSLSLQHEKHFKLDKALKKELKAHMEEWIKTSSDGPYNYKVKDVVFRLAGTGSVGVKRYLFLLKSTNTKGKFLLVEMKQCLPSSLAPYHKIEQPNWETEADRVISTQKRMQHMSAALLSATVFRAEAFLIQELQPVKDTLVFKMISDNYRDIYQVIHDMGVLTASAQLRSGGISGSATIDELMKFGQSQSHWQDKTLETARQLADQTNQDYQEFLSARDAQSSGIFDVG